MGPDGETLSILSRNETESLLINSTTSNQLVMISYFLQRVKTWLGVLRHSLFDIEKLCHVCTAAQCDTKLHSAIPWKREAGKV